MRKNFKGILIFLAVAAAAVLVFNFAFNNCHVGVRKAAAAGQSAQKAVLSKNKKIQEIKTPLDAVSYPHLVVQKGTPVKWNLTAKEGSLNYCNNEIIISKLKITRKLNLGNNVIEFTPKETGVINYTCWMGMIGGTITVVDDLSKVSQSDLNKGGASAQPNKPMDDC